MSRLPRMSGRDTVKLLAKIGYLKDRQTGSHIVLRQQNYPHRRVVIPDHREIAKGTLRAIIHQVGLTIEEFVALYQG